MLTIRIEHGALFAPRGRCLVLGIHLGTEGEPRTTRSTGYPGNTRKIGNDFLSLSCHSCISWFLMNALRQLLSTWYVALATGISLQPPHWPENEKSDANRGEDCPPCGGEARKQSIVSRESLCLLPPRGHPTCCVFPEKS